VSELSAAAHLADARRTIAQLDESEPDAALRLRLSGFVLRDQLLDRSHPL
jgi:hypothetical protein